MYVTPLEFQFCNSCRLPISGSFFLFFFFILSSYLLIIIPLPTPFPSVLYLLHFSTYSLLFQIISPLSSFSLHATFNPYHFLSFYIPSCQSFLLPLPFHSLRSSNTPPLFCTIFKLFFYISFLCIFSFLLSTVYKAKERLHRAARESEVRRRMLITKQNQQVKREDQSFVVKCRAIR